MSKLKQEIASAPSFSFTTDIWSTEVSDDSMISLTAHWINDCFVKKEAVLHVKSFPESHTGENICNTFNTMLENWNIEKTSVHLVVRDNASNMVKAFRDGGYSDLGCFAHTLQLVIHDAVFSQRSVSETLSLCRRIVGHFKRFPLACAKLKKIQIQLGLPEHRLKQDVTTRWNSTLYMLKSIQEQKMALGAYSTDSNNDVPQLTPNQLDLVSKLITLLTPIEEITQSISSDESTASVIIPFVRALRKHLQTNDENDRGVRTMKTEMLLSLNTRFEVVETEKPLVLATLLDPCFRDKCFSNTTNRVGAKNMLEQEVKHWKVHLVLRQALTLKNHSLKRRSLV